MNDNNVTLVDGEEYISPPIDTVNGRGNKLHTGLASFGCLNLRIYFNIVFNIVTNVNPNKNKRPCTNDVGDIIIYIIIKNVIKKGLIKANILNKLVKVSVIYGLFVCDILYITIIIYKNK
tara:strand:- start:3852 stop:4211 length:360 start_codon:yes stop_codon:yes gene_type:complete